MSRAGNKWAHPVRDKTPPWRGGTEGAEYPSPLRSSPNIQLGPHDVRNYVSLSPQPYHPQAKVASNDPKVCMHACMCVCVCVYVCINCSKSYFCLMLPGHACMHVYVYMYAGVYVRIKFVSRQVSF
jgi:hypothetical protein